MALPDKTVLARLPTPLERFERLESRWGAPPLYIKRDDLTGFGLSGNKVRKLEYHFAAATAAGAVAVATCGAVQSNHCRATAVAAARLGMKCHLFLRTPDGNPPLDVAGNHLIDRITGAVITFVDPDWYGDRDARMAEHAAATGHLTWIIPEGASDGLGMWGYVEAATELNDQLAALNIDRVVQWHAASSGGTTAGLAYRPREGGAASTIVAISVSDPAADLLKRVKTIWADALDGEMPADAGDRLVIRDDYLGGGYGVATADELSVQADASAATGLLFDPTYTGKALYALHVEATKGTLDPEVPVVFWHTGGGFAALAADSFGYGAG